MLQCDVDKRNLTSVEQMTDIMQNFYLYGEKRLKLHPWQASQGFTSPIFYTQT